MGDAFLEAVRSFFGVRPDRIDPAKYRLEDEPVPVDAPVDYRYQFELMRDRVEREEDRGKGLDGKIATVLAGITASIGFSLRINAHPATYAVTFLYMLPLIWLFRGFRTAPLKESPTAESIHDSFGEYPISTLAVGIQAMMQAIKDNRSINDRKADLLDVGIIQSIVVTGIVLLVNLVISLGVFPNEKTAPAGYPTPVPTLAPKFAAAVATR